MNYKERKSQIPRYLLIEDVHYYLLLILIDIGLVLGGGGARGCAHIGMIKAILEAGVPIDTVAGVSIGSFIGGLYSRERDITAVTVKAREFSTKISQVKMNMKYNPTGASPHSTMFPFHLPY